MKFFSTAICFFISLAQHSYDQRLNNKQEIFKDIKHDVCYKIPVGWLKLPDKSINLYNKHHRVDEQLFFGLRNKTSHSMMVMSDIDLKGEKITYSQLVNNLTDTLNKQFGFLVKQRLSKITVIHKKIGDNKFTVLQDVLNFRDGRFLEIASFYLREEKNHHVLLTFASFTNYADLSEFEDGFKCTKILDL